MRRTNGGRRVVDMVLLNIPVVGTLVQKIALARFTRVLAMIIRSGVPIVQGLEIIARASGNAIVAQAVESTAVNVREGQSISASLSQNTLFPPMLWNMVAVGEQTGALEESLDKIADFYDREVGNTVGPIRLDSRTGDDRHRRRHRRLRRRLDSLAALAPAERDPLGGARATRPTARFSEQCSRSF